MGPKKNIKGKSRKEIRKELRKAKKVKKFEFFTKGKSNFKGNKNANTKNFVKAPHDGEPFQRKLQDEFPQKNGKFQSDKKKSNKNKISKKSKKDFKSVQDSLKYEILQEKAEENLLKKEMQKKRMEVLKEDNLKEDAEIRKLEKQLKLNRRKESSILKSFASDGLDYLLEACSKDIETEHSHVDMIESDSEFEDDLALITGKKTSKEVKKSKRLKTEGDVNFNEDESKSEQENEDDYDADSLLSEGNTEIEDSDCSVDIDNFEGHQNSLSRDFFTNSKVKSKDNNTNPEVLSDLDEDAGRHISETDSEVEFDNRKQTKRKKSTNSLKSSKQKRTEDSTRSENLSDSELDDNNLNDGENKILESGLKSSKKSKSENLTKENKIVKQVIVVNSNMKSSRKNLTTNKLVASQIKNDLEDQSHSENDDRKVKKKTKKVTFSESMEDNELKTRHCDEDSEDGFSEDFDEEIEMSEENPRAVDNVWEDIYGRKRDNQGNVIQAYKPPHLRKNIQVQSNEKLARLKKQLKGLMNRLAENNMASISSQIEELYMSNSRNDMNETLCQLLSESLISEVLHPERLIAEHAMLVAILNANVGNEVGAHCLQHMVIRFSNLLKESTEVEDKRVNNVLLFITHLYNFRVFHSLLMYDIINELLKKLEEKQIELLLMALKTVGFILRKDDPVALKSLVLKVQEEANRLAGGELSSRVKFMLEIVLAIKNNNMSKIANYNPEVIEHLKKSLKVMIRKGNYNSELKISLQDLINAEEHGRWWVVGSAWSGNIPGEANSEKQKQMPIEASFSQTLLDLARKQRMNTDIRRNVFCVLMSAEDYLDAFEKLIRLGLKGTVEREIMNVVLHCTLQEKIFNPYYVHLATKFSLFDRKYQMMLQCSIWDKIKDIKNLSPLQATNLSKFIGNMCLRKGLPISVLKVVEFSELDKSSVRFIRQILLTILLSSNEEEEALAVFSRIAQSSKLKVFREGLRLFLHHFVLRNTKNMPEDDVAQLKNIVEKADKVLSSSDLNIVF